MGRTPHPTRPRHQPRAARLALRNTLKPILSSETQMNTNRTGLAVITSHTSLTTVLIVLTLLRMLVTVVVVDSGGSSFPKIHGCGGRSRTSISRLRAWPATITHTPPCNTLRRRSAYGSAPQRAVIVLHYQLGQCPLNGEQLILNGTQRPGRNIIMR